MQDLAPIPSIDPSKSALIKLAIRSITVESTRVTYTSRLSIFLDWIKANGKDLNRQSVIEFRDSLIEQGKGGATVRLSLQAIRSLCKEAKYERILASDVVDGILDVKAKLARGAKTGVWLTKKEAEILLNAPNHSTLKGCRDRVVIGLMVGCGLRRAEVTGLKWGQIQQRDGRWIVADMLGKGNKYRTVAVPSWLKVYIDSYEGKLKSQESWLLSSLDNPFILSIRKGDHLDTPLHGVSEHAIWDIVKFYCSSVESNSLAPHDLRRTFGKLAHKGGVALEQISLSLGHEDLKTTKIYLNIEQDFVNAPADMLGINPLRGEE